VIFFPPKLATQANGALQAICLGVDFYGLERRRVVA